VSNDFIVCRNLWSYLRTLEHVSRIERYDRHVPARRVQDNISKQRHVSWRTPGTCRDLSKHLLTLGTHASRCFSSCPTIKLLTTLRFTTYEHHLDDLLYSRCMSVRITSYYICFYPFLTIKPSYISRGILIRFLAVAKEWLIEIGTLIMLGFN